MQGSLLVSRIKHIHLKVATTWHLFKKNALQYTFKKQFCQPSLFFISQEEAPPLPLRTRNLDGGILSNQDGVLYAQLRKKAPKRTPYNCQKKILEHKQGRSAAQAGSAGRTYAPLPAAPQTVYSKLGLLDSKTRSLPMLDSEQSYRLRSSPGTPPRRNPRPVSQMYGYDRRQQPDWLDSCSSSSDSRGSWENVSDGAVYYLAGRPGSPHTARASEAQRQQEDSVYAEVKHVGACQPTRGREEAAQPEDGSDTYEPVEDVRPKHKRSSWVSKVSQLFGCLCITVCVRVAGNGDNKLISFLSAE